MKPADCATFEDLARLFTTGEIRRSYEGNNRVYKIKVILDDGQQRRLTYTFETTPGFCSDQRNRYGKLESKVEE